MYSQEMMDSVERLEKTRSGRLGQEFPALSLPEKEALLKGYHPDYRKGTLRELAVGPNKGENTLGEIADILEARSLLDPAAFDPGEPDHEADVLVIGGGGAGVSAALTAQEEGAKVLLATKLRLGDANTMMAQGGIQAADKPNDSPPIHFLDVIGGGGFTNTPPLVRALVTDGPAAIQWLERLGVMFDKEKDGTMISIHGGGTSRKRMHSARDYTGGEIMKTLRDEIRNRGIEVIEFSPAIELLTGDDGAVTGAVLRNLETGEHIVVRAKTTILATGGCGRLHILGFPTSNHYGATADGLVMGYRAGNPVVFMDTIQYHPTGAAYPEQIVGLLITEKCRGLGAHLINDEGERFIYELETRDAEAAAIIREVDERKKGVRTPGGMTGVWLDTPMIDVIHGEGAIQAKLPAMYRQFMRFDVDMSREPLLVYPTQHYQNGGLVIDENGAARVDGLFTAGEVEGGVHGRNRLMGNSLLEVVVFGRRAGRAAAAAARGRAKGKLTLGHVESYHRELARAGVAERDPSPLVLPDYRRKESLARMVDS